MGPILGSQASGVARVVTVSSNDLDNYTIPENVQKPQRIDICYERGTKDGEGGPQKERGV